MHILLVMWLTASIGFVAVPGCDEGGDGDADSDTDSDADSDGDADGDGDADSDSDGDTDGDAEAEPARFDIIVRAIDYTVRDLRGGPLTGAFIAIDEPAGRLEATTNDAGEATFEVSDGAQPFTITVAHPGFTVATYSDIGGEMISRIIEQEG